MAGFRGVGGASDLDRGRLGLVLVVVAVVGSATVFGLSAAAAPGQEVEGDAGTRTLVGIQGGGLGYHDHGRVALVDERGETRWTVANADSYFDVTWLDDGTVMAGFMDGGAEDCGDYRAPCTRTGFRILDPGADDPTVFEYSYPVRTASNSETHDVERLPSGEYVLTDMEHERIYTIRPDGEVTWQWNASSVYAAPSDPTRVDWLHINDVDFLGQDRFLVSVRNANQLLVVERGVGVVDVVNRGGDREVLFQQHNPQWLSENAVLVADSENDRVVELHREEPDAEWEIVWGLEAANGLPLRWPRDADRLANGNTLVTDSRNQRVIEVAKNGSVVWSATFEYVPYEAERLPEGERVGAARYTPTEEGIVIEDGGDVPVLTRGLALARAGYPLPVWVSEWHLLVAVLGLLTAVGGSGLWAVDRVGRRGDVRGNA